MPISLTKAVDASCRADVVMVRKTAIKPQIEANWKLPLKDLSRLIGAALDERMDESFAEPSIVTLRRSKIMEASIHVHTLKS